MGGWAWTILKKRASGLLMARVRGAGAVGEGCAQATLQPSSAMAAATASRLAPVSTSTRLAARSI